MFGSSEPSNAKVTEIHSTACSDTFLLWLDQEFRSAIDGGAERAASVLEDHIANRTANALGSLFFDQTRLIDPPRPLLIVHSRATSNVTVLTPRRDLHAVAKTA